MHKEGLFPAARAYAGGSGEFPNADVERVGRDRRSDRDYHLYVM